MTLELSKVTSQVAQLGEQAALRTQRYRAVVPDLVRALTEYTADADVRHVVEEAVRNGWTGGVPANEPLDAAGLLLQHISDAVASSGTPFLDLAANQVEFAAQLQAATTADFGKLGLKLEMVTVQNVSLPEELQKVLDQKIGMGMVGGDMGKFMQYQTAQAIPKFAEGAAGAGGGGGGVVGDAMGLGAGVALGQVMAQQLSQGLQGAAPQAVAAAPVGVKPDEVMASIEKLAELKGKGILSQEEFDAKKAELLKKLV